jgi:polyferredoxin
VLIFGEPGLEKANIAALIHFGSPDRKQPLIEIDCNTLQPNGAELFGRTGGKVGLIDWLGEGTLILNNLECIPSGLNEKIAALLQTQTYSPVHREGESAPHPKICRARILLTSEKMLTCLENLSVLGHTIKVPPLRVRKADIAAQVDYYLTLLARSRQRKKPQVTPEALRKLQGYDFPGNLEELNALVDRALTQAAGAQELTEEVFWPASEKTKRFRVNLLNAYPQLRQFLRSAWYPDQINFGFTSWFFAIVVLVLFLGPQTRDRNVMLNFFWDWWWLGSCLVFPFLGRIWCTFCPFMIYGEITQKTTQKLFPNYKLRSWPRQLLDRWAGWFLFGLFTLILLWEELWDLPNTAYLSGWLLILITAGAMICSALFERRLWCRYLCPIGGMNGLFAKLSMLELRAQQGICSASCNTYHCYKGGPAEGEGQDTSGCPVYSHPAQLQDNKDCVLCMTCLKACPHRSVELNLRPPGIELWTTHKSNWPEVALLFLLFGSVFLHHLPIIQQVLAPQLSLHIWGWHSLFSLIALLIPVTIAGLSHQLLRWVNPTNVRSFKTLAYGYLPLVLGGTMAHYWQLGLAEAGRLLPVTVATIGWSAIPGLPVWVAHPAVIAFLQGATLLAAGLLSVVLTQKIAKQAWRFLWPQHVTIGLLAGLMWWVIL